MDPTEAVLALIEAVCHPTPVVDRQPIDQGEYITALAILHDWYSSGGFAPHCSVLRAGDKVMVTISNNAH